jgi:2-polyprenyl-6-methoxyphenol hydroxylase-like FAD-dependent oxidoreductase
MDRRAIIIGAGPAGLTAALALRRVGWDVRVAERAPSLSARGAGLTLWPNAVRALELVGAADAVRAEAVPCAGIALRNARGRTLDATSRETMEAHWGGTGLALRRARLLETLLGLVGADAVRFGASCSGVRHEPGGAAAEFEDGSVWRAELVIGADGIRSAVRDGALGPARLRYAGFPVWRAVTRFRLPADVGLTTLGRAAQFGLFPVAGGRVYWFASFTAPEGAYADGPHRLLLLERFRDWHEPIPDVVAATREEEIVWSPVHDIDPLRRWASGHVVVVGDAAHASTPHLGQGACQAIEDAVVLGACLAAEPDVPAALRELERRRVDRAARLSLQARRLAQLGRRGGRLMEWARDTTIAHTPPRARHRQLASLFEWDSAWAAAALAGLTEQSRRSPAPAGLVEREPARPTRR